MTALGALENKALQNSSYEFVGRYTCGGWNERIVTRYELRDDSPESLISAAEAIRQLLSDNPQFCPLFLTNNDQLTLHIQQRKYLTINGSAVCLSEEREAPPGASTFKDEFFSEALVREPVRCKENHVLEKEYAQFWIDIHGNICPGGDHPIARDVASLPIDESLRHEVEAFKKREEQEFLKTLYFRSQLAIAQGRTLEIHHTTNIDFVAVGSGVTKFFANYGASKVVMLLSAKTAEKTASMTLKKGVKVLPFVGLFIGVACAAWRLYKEEFIKAGLEVGSGVASCFPGSGTGISIALNSGLLMHDAYQGSEVTTSIIEQTPNDQIKITMTLENAYDVLGLSQTLPTKESVDRAYHQCTLQLHEDRVRRVMGEDFLQSSRLIIKFLNNVKSMIYEKRDWQ
ncbi:MAG: hypothetical protein ACRDFB_06115 [Rhabdochlamydiaceae bacterium]